MKIFLTGFLLASSGLAQEPAAMSDAVQRGLGLLEKTSPQFIKRGGCNSCHNQLLPAATQAMARYRAINVSKAFAQLPVASRQEPSARIPQLITTLPSISYCTHHYHHPSLPLTSSSTI